MGKTIMVSSHILPELADICNKIGIIEQGELLVNADVGEVMKQVRGQTLLNIKVFANSDSVLIPAPGRTATRRRPNCWRASRSSSDRTGDDVLLVTLRPEVAAYDELAYRSYLWGGYKLTLFKEDELNLETAFMALTKGITS